MAQRSRSAVLLAVVAGALAVAGCGAGSSADGAGGLAVPKAAPLAGPAVVELDDGRLGGATTVRPDGPLRELSRGGRLDLRPRERALRRDGVGAGASCPNPDLAPAPDSLGAIAEATLCLLNGERADRGLAPLALNAQLSAAAGAYAQDLVAGSYFSHTGRDGSDLRTRVARTGYLRDDRGWALGENLAWGTGSLGTPGSIMVAWMNSPGHRDNILNPEFREIGIGVVTGNPALADGAGATYATEFGAIEDAEPVASSSQPQPARRRTAKRARRHARARVARHGKHHRHHKRHRAKHRRISAHA